MDPMIEANDLGKTYPGGIDAVQGIDFEVAAGEVFGLLGPNGAGKSTTVGMFTTTVRPTSGTARLAGFDVAAEPLAVRSVSSVVFQEPVVDRSLTGRRNLEIHARLWGVEPREAQARIEEIAATFELIELHVDGNATSALALLRERGVAGDDAFAVGSRLTVPLHDASSREAIAAIHDLGLAGAISAREPSLDDVYLRLTGDSLAAAA